MQIEQITEANIAASESTAKTSLENAWKVWDKTQNGLSMKDADNSYKAYERNLRQVLAWLRLSISFDKNPKMSLKAQELRLKAGRYKLQMQGELLKLQGRFSEALQAERIALNKEPA